MIFILLAIFFVLLLFFFSGIETGLVSLLKPRVQHAVKQNVRSAQILDFFIRNPGYMLATALIGTNISLVCSSNMMKQAFELFGFRSAEAMLGLACIWSVVLLGAEIVSKDWFRQQTKTPI